MSGISEEKAPVGRALFSVYDKTGVVELASALQGEGWEIVASGGTASELAAGGVAVSDLAEYTGVPAFLDHRVVSLHPKVHGGILFDRDNPDHVAELDAHEIRPFDMVVVNLYPFSSRPGADMIDIGGSALLRAAAKNHAWVSAVSDPADYSTVIKEVRSQGKVSEATRSRLARAAFAYTSAYDAAITAWFDQDLPQGFMPPSLHLALQRVGNLRYGENPHQAGAHYRPWGVSDWWSNAVQHGGLPPSFLNLFDAQAAWEIVSALGDRPAAAIIKHANPCGVAQASSPGEALNLAFQCDPRSSFGGVIALNRPFDEAAAKVMQEAPQADLVIAPGFEEGVVESLLRRRRNTRILEVSDEPVVLYPRGLSLRQLAGGWLAQEPDSPGTPEDWRLVTQRSPSRQELEDAFFAWRVCAHVSSNAVVMAMNEVAWGIGAGQPDRVGAAEMAVSKAGGRAIGGACASDGFFPFPDGLETAASAGVAVVVQPGGSVNDEQVIARADQLGLSMLFTGRRKFLHR